MLIGENMGIGVFLISGVIGLAAYSFGPLLFKAKEEKKTVYQVTCQSHEADGSYKSVFSARVDHQGVIEFPLVSYRYIVEELKGQHY